MGRFQHPIGASVQLSLYHTCISRMDLVIVVQVRPDFDRLDNYGSSDSIHG